jgi:hypothetical protein
VYWWRVVTNIHNWTARVVINMWFVLESIYRRKLPKETKVIIFFHRIHLVILEKAERRVNLTTTYISRFYFLLLCWLLMRLLSVILVTKRNIMLRRSRPTSCKLRNGWLCVATSSLDVWDRVNRRSHPQHNVRVYRVSRSPNSVKWIVTWPCGEVKASRQIAASAVSVSPLCIAQCEHA